MATTQPGGIYKVGDSLVDANGEPAKRARAQKAAPEPSDAFDVEKATKAELQAEAERRGITVVRGDGEDGEPRVIDYREALK